MVVTGVWNAFADCLRDAASLRAHHGHARNSSPGIIESSSCSLAASGLRTQLSCAPRASSVKRLAGLSLALIMLPTLTPDCAAAAETFSVRCEGGVPVRPYFATFDVDAKAVVFETPPTNVETNFGINAHSGEIISTNDGEIEFVLHVRPGRFDLIFNRDRKTMSWPGLEDPTFRPTLTHQCNILPPRSILSFRVRDPIQHPISVRCEDAGYMYFTMDTA